MYIIPFEYATMTDYIFVIDIEYFDVKNPEDIRFDIYAVWKDEDGMTRRTLMPDTWPDYNKEEVYELAIKKAMQTFYSKQVEIREMVQRRDAL